jgi:glycosyltransferase involved in cell wall biosynthesis
MRVLVCHNYYQQPGGEDGVFASEVALLRSKGHDVSTFSVHNDDVVHVGRARLAWQTFWNNEISNQLASKVRRDRIDLVHFHNTFPRISPASYPAVRNAGAAVVQTLHNYRLSCPSATFFRDGRVCEDCLGRRFPWPAIKYKCYRSDRAASAVTSGMLLAHRALRTWHRHVDRFVALTTFSASKMVEAGLPRQKVVVKPNFLDIDPGFGAGDGRFALFIGRLSAEKGISALLEAWKQPGLPELRIVGDGPLRDHVASAPQVKWLGRQPAGEVMNLLKSASLLVFPSVWYEGMPRTIVESLACGTPVLASDLGSMREMIMDGVNGWLVPPGHPVRLGARVKEIFADPATLAGLRHSARADYLAKYTSEVGYDRLMTTYEAAISTRRSTFH